MTRTVVLFGREGCCLCDDAREILLSVRRKHPFALQERDIEDDDSLLRAYLERIPVVTVDGIEVFELFVDEHELIRLLSPSASEQASRGARAGRDERPGEAGPARP